MAEKIIITLPKELVDKIHKKIEKTNFNSISDYILFILKQVISDEEINIKLKNDNFNNKKEEEEIKKNLKELGYL